MLTKVTVLLTIIITAFTAVALSHSLQEDKEYSAIRTKQALKIDGWLNEPIWKKAPTATGFIQDYPERGKAPTESTFVKIVYDDEALYVAFICFDSEPDKIVRRLAKRDQSGNADFIRIEIDSYHDHRTGYLFQINTADIQLDGYRYNDGWRDDSWDAVWDGRAQITDFGYTAELKIPYSCLRFNNHRVEHTWGINLLRYIPRKNEVLVWSYVPPDNQGYNSRFGHLTGIRGIEPRTHLELMPYAVTSGESEPKSLGNPDGRDYAGDLGVDFKYGLTSNLTLDATINPDFGQVEADPAVLNLSTFETWYPEKRPFFIEGDKYFETKFTLFYSRRIGQRPGDWPDDVDYYVREPKNTTILGAGKITGRTDNGWVIGFLNSVTREEEATYVNEDGQRLTSTVEQPANWNVTRIKREFDNGSSLGIIGTAVHQEKHTPVYAGGLDWDLKFADRRYLFDGQIVGSQYDGDGLAAFAAFRRESGKHIRWAFGSEYESEDFNINRIGFIGRSDYAGGWGWWQYRNQDNWWIFRDMYHNLNYWQSHNLDGDKINIGANYNATCGVKGNWAFWYGFEIEPEHYDDRETRDGPLYWNPESHASWYGAETDFPGWINYGASLTWGSDRDGRILSSSVWTTLKFSDRLKI
ncbi:MAG: hypothetical protein GF307_10935, partial [candidate division Zixibacteria bacterium]|nr:hypothetical protein [candidate division Zixibacteria bacterium]